MAAPDVNEDAVERRKQNLLDAYGDVPVRENRNSVPANAFPEWLALSREGYVGSAYALVRRSPEAAPELTPSMSVDGPETERILLILPRGLREWAIPGGGREGEETFEETAVREVEEETGIECEIDALRYLRHDVSTSTGDHPERLHAIRAFFDARYVDGTIAIQGGECNGAAWFADPPERRLPEVDRTISNGSAPDSGREPDSGCEG